MTRIRWGRVLEHAAEIVESYDTGVTLQQLFFGSDPDDRVAGSERSTAASLTRRPRRAKGQSRGSVITPMSAKIISAPASMVAASRTAR